MWIKLIRIVRFSVLLCWALLKAGAAEGQTTPIHLFDADPETRASAALWKNALDHAVVLRFDSAAAREMVRERPERITMVIPHALRSLTFELERVEPIVEGLTITTVSGARHLPTEAVHYRGKVHGAMNSLAAITISGAKAMGIVGLNGDDYVLGELHGSGGLHVLYRESDLRRTNSMRCEVADEQADGLPLFESKGGERSVRCVQVYVEVGYEFWASHSNGPDSGLDIIGLFNQVAALYAAAGIDLLLSGVLLWDQPDPYTATSQQVLLGQFTSLRQSFNGNAAILLKGGGQGGAAWTASLCHPTLRPMAACRIDPTFQNVPLYSWSVEVIAHELGHILGSQHTHACAWNGNSTAIDGCGPANGFVEGSCPAGPIPGSHIGGTIMSYCHLMPSGISFSNGFGPQPAARMLGFVENAACVPSCAGPCTATWDLQATSIYADAARIKWRAVPSTSYRAQWRHLAGGNWNSSALLNDTTFLITGLLAGNSYAFRVINHCGASSSATSDEAGFTTLPFCPDTYEPNDSPVQAASASWSIPIISRLSSSTDVDYYYLSTEPGVLTVVLTHVQTSHIVELINPLGEVVATSSIASGQVILGPVFVGWGGYYVRVSMPDGTEPNLNCYALTRTFLSTCDPPEPNDTHATATGTTWSSEITGWISSIDDVDYFRMSWTVTGQFSAQMVQMQPGHFMRLENQFGAIVGSSVLVDGYVRINPVPVSAGTYYLRVSRAAFDFSDPACYSITRDLAIDCPAPPPPQFESISYSSAVLVPGSLSGYAYGVAHLKRVGMPYWSQQYPDPGNPWLMGLAPESTYQLVLEGRCSWQYSGSGFSDTVTFVTLPEPCIASVFVHARAILDGAFDPATGLMSDSLRRQGLIPLVEPYLAMGYDVHGVREIASAVLEVEGPDAIVDWVILSVGGWGTPYVYAALLQRDGDIVGHDGVSSVQVCLPPGQWYRVGVKHRNHLGCTTDFIEFGVSSADSPQLIDFTAPLNLSEASSRRNRDGLFTLWAGDCLPDFAVSYIGAFNDRDAILQRLGGDPVLQLPGYFPEDANLDGVVKYFGARNDRDVILMSLDGNPAGNRYSY